MEVLLLPNLTCDLTCDLTNRNWSSRNYWEKIEVPMVYINALDDPLIPPKMLEPVRQLAGNGVINFTLRLRQCIKTATRVLTRIRENQEE